METLTIRKKIHFKLGRNNRNQIIQGTPEPVIKKLEWFITMLINSISDSLEQTESIFKKAKFWQENENIAFSADQQKIINKLFDGFEGNLTSSKWAKICKCSQDTANRAIADLIEKGIFVKIGLGRSTHYKLNVENQ